MVAVGFIPRIGQVQDVRRGAMLESPSMRTFNRRSATRFNLLVSFRGLKATATIGNRSAIAIQVSF